ncbi:MAG: PSD1 and planctomycete cytochrome C domain-containing protein [Pirellulaceae bacterium]|nr:PSD1 domain-containing protein [Planctomycetales bacterium]
MRAPPIWLTGLFCCLAYGMNLGLDLPVQATLAAEENAEENTDQADLSSEAHVDFFEKRIRPVLVEHCYECHSSHAEKVRGELLVDSRPGLLAGGSSGPSVVPGDPESSMLISALRHQDFEMPPDGKLADSVIEDFVAWIRHGAHDPRQAAAAPPNRTRREIDLQSGRRFWAFQPVRVATAPDLAIHRSWPRDLLDRFIVAQWPLQDTSPSSPASQVQLIRRLSYDLTGLPPSPRDIKAFVDDTDPQAYARLVDRLLATPAFGQRWGRHWLDVARFAESSGGGRSLMLPDAWRYRDYVIDAYNNDLPFDRFVVEQIAGDLLPFESLEQRDRQRIAAGFLALGPTNYEMQDKEQLQMEVIDEQIDTIGRAFLGLTLGCARCHDHKFDPVPTEDYYALAGIFKSTKLLTPGNVSGFYQVELDSLVDQPALEAHNAQVAELQQQLSEKRSTLGLNDTNNGESSDKKKKQQADHPELKPLIDELAALEKKKPPIPKAMSVTDEQQTGDTQLLIRGVVRNFGDIVPRGTVSVLCPVDDQGQSASQLAIPDGASGRLELARWIAAPDNPLTARVYVNRVWQHLIGVGLVATPDNFGTTGLPPTHPELLDYLTDQFIRNGWSTKYLVRRIVNSSTYRLSTEATPAAIAADPTNALLTRAHRRPLDAESLRDSLLVIGDNLDATAGGLTIRKITEYDRDYQFDSHRRSVYVPRFRNSILDIFEVFDAANPNLVVGRRANSIIPTQSLYLMNSPFVLDQAYAAADHLLQDVHAIAGVQGVAAWPDQLDYVTLQCWGRLPTDGERSLLGELYRSTLQAAAPESEREAWAAVYHACFAALEFRYLN